MKQYISYKLKMKDSTIYNKSGISIMKRYIRLAKYRLAVSDRFHSIRSRFSPGSMPNLETETR